LAVRPEDLSIFTEADSGSPEENFSSIPGLVEKSSFTGSLVRYTVDCGQDVSLTVERYKPDRESLILPNGASVFVRIPSHSLLLFNAETGERL
ncbi:MAG: TOBE domain-containing protein, partial [bacterium]|nr:TOBE domain-containing protein [bacterium]